MIMKIVGSERKAARFGCRSAINDRAFARQGRQGQASDDSKITGRLDRVGATALPLADRSGLPYAASRIEPA
jgi:hypothetical protein